MYVHIKMPAGGMQGGEDAALTECRHVRIHPHATQSNQGF